MPNVKWRVIPSLPEYMASSDGYVMRIPHFAPMPNGGLCQLGGVPRRGCWDKTRGRYTIMYRGKTYKVARLVCEAFYSLAPFDGAVVMHLNEDASDNRATNLRWGTQQDNLNAPGFLHYCRSRTGDASPTRKHRRKQTQSVPF